MKDIKTPGEMHLQTIQKKSINSEYMLFLKQNCVEKNIFLLFQNPHVLKCFINIGISSHSLSIKTGRYNNTLVNERKIMYFLQI